jgi:hypothetical protein
MIRCHGMFLKLLKSNLQDVLQKKERKSQIAKEKHKNIKCLVFGTIGSIDV